MKRYLLFSGHDYYPIGGMGDFAGDFDTLEAAIESANSFAADWQEIYDQQERKAVWSKYRGIIQ